MRSLRAPVGRRTQPPLHAVFGEFEDHLALLVGVLRLVERLDMANHRGLVVQIHEVLVHNLKLLPHLFRIEPDDLPLLGMNRCRCAEHEEKEK